MAICAAEGGHSGRRRPDQSLDSRVVRDNWGHDQDDTVQALATCDWIVVAPELTKQATKVHEFRPMVEAVNEHSDCLDKRPIGVLSADADVRALAEAGFERLIASCNDPQSASCHRLTFRCPRIPLGKPLRRHTGSRPKLREDGLPGPRLGGQPHAEDFSANIGNQITRAVRSTTIGRQARCRPAGDRSSRCCRGHQGSSSAQIRR